MTESAPWIPDYELVRCIGAGSYGEVWLSRSVTGQYRAVKLVHRQQFDKGRPFEREFAGLLKFEPISRSHPGFVNILHVGKSSAPDGIYYVMELADDHLHGQQIDPTSYVPRTLSTELTHRRQLPIEECVQLGLSLSAALMHLHAQGLVHRDIKPSNIILVDGAPKLADIGLVTSTDGTKSFVGTEGYLPPEGPGSVQADLYSLGKVLYEISTGKDRHEFPELPADFADRPDARRLLELNEVTLAACEGDTSHRYQTAAQMHEDLVRLQQGGSLRRTRLLRRVLPRVARLTVRLALLGAILGVGWLIRQQSRRQLFEQAMGLVADGDKLKQIHRFDLAAENYRQARMGLEKARAPTLAADLGLWEISQKAPAPLNTLRTNTSAAHAVAFLPDGRRAISAADNDLLLWDVVTGHTIRSFTGHTNVVWSVAVSPDGRQALSGSLDRSLRLWDVDSGREVASWIAEGAVLAVAYSPDGSNALTGGADNVIRLWDLAKTQAVLSLTGHVGKVFSVAVSSDGRQALSGSSDNSVKLWDLNKGTLLRTFVGHSNTVYCVALSPDGSRAVSGSVDGTVRLWDTTNGREIQKLIQARFKEPIDSLAFSLDGRFILSAAGDQTARLFDANTGDETRVFYSHHGRVYSVCFSPDSRLALSACADGTLELWDVATNLEMRQVNGHSGAVRSLTFSPDGLLVLSVGDDGAAKLWDTATAQMLRELAGRTNLTCAALAPDCQRAVLGYADGVLKLWNLMDGSWRAVAGVRDAVLAAAFSVDGSRAFAVRRDGTVAVIDVMSGRESGGIERVTRSIRCAAFSGDGRRLILDSTDDKLTLLDVATGKIRRVFSKEVQPVTSVALSQDGHYALTAGLDPEQDLWALKLWRDNSTQEPDLHSGQTAAITAIALSPSGGTCLSGGSDWTIRLWAQGHKGDLRTLVGHTNSVTAVAYCTSRLAVVSGTDTGRMIFWNIYRVEPNLQFEMRRDGATLADLGEWYAFRGRPDWATSLLELARSGGATISNLTLARAYWETDHPAEARQELLLARSRKEAPEVYLELCRQALK